MNLIRHIAIILLLQSCNNAPEHVLEFSGDEPYQWHCLISPNESIILDRETEGTIVFPCKLAADSADDFWNHEASVSKDGITHVIKIFVKKKPCIDGLSGDENAYYIDLTLDDRVKLSGCGGAFEKG